MHLDTSLSKEPSRHIKSQVSSFARFATCRSSRQDALRDLLYQKLGLPEELQNGLACDLIGRFVRSVLELGKSDHSSYKGITMNDL